MYNAPLSPLLDVPVLNTIIPLTPASPALGVDINTLPLDDTVLYPDTIDIRPPDDEDDMPADNTNSPPVPLLPEPTLI